VAPFYFKSCLRTTKGGIEFLSIQHCLEGKRWQRLTTSCDAGSRRTRANSCRQMLYPRTRPTRWTAITTLPRRNFAAINTQNKFFRREKHVLPAG
jgi:hypothetical protein